MKSIKIQLLLIVSLGVVIIAPLSIEGGFSIGKAWSSVKNTVKAGYNVVEDQASKAKRAAEDQARKIKDIGERVSSAGGAVLDAGVKIGNVTVKALSEAGEVTLDVASKATGGISTVVLKAGQSMVNAAGMTILNVGGMIWALTSGDLSQFSDCANAVYSSAKYGVSTVVDSALKTIGNVDLIVEIKEVSIEATTSELMLQGKSPKMSIKGSFWGKDFALTDVQLDFSKPDKLIADLADKLIKLKIG